MIQAEFEKGIEDENNFQIQVQEIDFQIQNGADEDDALLSIVFKLFLYRI